MTDVAEAEDQRRRTHTEDDEASRDGNEGDGDSRSSDERGGAQGDGDRDEGRRRIAAKDVVTQARSQFAELTGRVPEAVSGLSHTGDGWRVTIDVVELERIPPTTDVLASFDVELDDDGNLLGYERVRRYQRGQADER